LEKAGLQLSPDGGVVLTGAGISYVDGCKQLAQEVFDVPVRVVQAGQLQNVLKPEYIASAGIIRYVANIKKRGSQASEVKQKKSGNPRSKELFFDRIKRLFNEIF